MGILARFRNVMKANVNGLLNKSNHPEQDVKAYIRDLSSDLGSVKAETAAVQADESRAKRALDECSAGIAKLLRYAEKFAEAGEDDKALRMLEQKAKQVEQHEGLRIAYERAAAKAEMMQRMQEKLTADMARLEARQAELNGKLSEARSREQALNGDNAAGAAFAAMEAKAQQALNEAEALAELRSQRDPEDLDVLIAELERKAAEGSTGGGTGTDAGTGAASQAAGQVPSAQQELAAIKDHLRTR